jgi:hypothetical protein
VVVAEVDFTGRMMLELLVYDDGVNVDQQFLLPIANWIADRLEFDVPVMQHDGDLTIIAVTVQQAQAVGLSSGSEVWVDEP